MNSTRIIIASVLLIFLAKYDTSTASEPGVEQLMDNAIHMFHKGEYFGGLDICRDIMNKYPENPVGYLGAATIYFGIMREYWINTHETEFDSLICLAIEKGRAAIDMDADNAENYFLYGSASGIRGLYRMKRGRWLSAFKDGLRGYRNVKKAYEMNTLLYDAYFGLGLYYYWKSVKAEVLTWLRFMRDEREKGIKFINIAVEKGRFAGMEGKLTLVRLFYFEERYEEAYHQCLALKEQFARNPAWLYLMAKASEKYEKREEATECYRLLLERVSTSSFGPNNGILAACHLGLAECAAAGNDHHEAKNHIHLARAYALKRDKLIESDGPLERFEDIFNCINDFFNKDGEYVLK